MPPSTTGQQAGRRSISDLELADQFLDSVSRDGYNFLTKKESRAGTNDGRDIEDTAIDNVKKNSKKRKTPASDMDDIVGLSASRKAMLSHLRSTLTKDSWNNMMSDGACALSTVKKKLQKFFDFAQHHKLLAEMTTKLRSMITKDSNYLEELSSWMESKINTDSLHMIDLTAIPAAGSASSGFKKLPNTTFIPATRIAMDVDEDQRKENFRQLLADNKLEEVETGGGGDCLFSSTATLLQARNAKEKAQLREDGLVEFTAIRIRRFAVQVIRANWEAYADFRTNTTGTGDPEEASVWLAEMEKSGRWGDNVIIQALSDYLGIEFMIFRDDCSIIHVFPKSSLQLFRIALVLRGECHYTATKPILPSRRRG